MNALVLSLMLLLSGASDADLTGKVVSPDGSAVGGASVIVYSASPKKGAATTNPSEYPDCQKSTATDGAGAFTIAGVDSSKTFELLVVSDSYRPLMLKKVDPTRGQITAKLKALPTDVDPQMLVRGRVVDLNGNPVVGGKIEINSYVDGNSTTFGGEESVIEPLTYTNAKGEFTLIAKKAGLTFNLLMHSREAAPMIAKGFVPGEDIREFSVTPGAKVTGRVVKDGQPLAGIKLMLIQTDRNSETWLDIESAFTDDSGRFTFAHVHSDTRYDLTPTTKTLAGRGCAVPVACQSTGDDTVVDAGDITIEPGLTLSGQLVASSGNPQWPEAKVRLERGDSWDDPVDIPVDKDGHFEFKGAAAGIANLSVKLDSFHLSKDNASVEPYRSAYLLGRIDDNITDLKIQLDPGPAENTHAAYKLGAPGRRCKRGD